MQTSFVFLVCLALIPLCYSICCDRDSVTECCGIGDCNIFCCNCDIGCKPMCHFDLGRKKRASVFETMVAEHRFKKLDYDMDGFVSMDEAMLFLVKSGRNSTQLEEDTAWFTHMDKNHDGKVEPTEFDHNL